METHGDISDITELLWLTCYEMPNTGDMSKFPDSYNEK